MLPSTTTVIKLPMEILENREPYSTLTIKLPEDILKDMGNYCGTCKISINDLIFFSVKEHMGRYKEIINN